MNLFQRLLLAPAALSAVGPMAASAGDLSPLNGMSAVNAYMQQHDIDRFRAWESQNQVTSVNQFSDVRPTDWAYQALSNLVEKYGCVAGYPNGTYKGGQAMTRYEAAALLNACLDRVTEVTDELQRLMKEFEKELAVLKGRVDGLEAKVGKLEAQQFSTTTKLRGETSFIIGGVDQWRSNATTDNNRTTFNYDARLSFDTSFSGKDLLRTRLRSGNFSSAPFGSSGNVFKLDKSEENKCDRTGSNNNSCVWIDRLFYTFPVGKEVKLTAGALVRNTEILSFIPSAYKSDILDFFALAGATGTYNKATGAGAGLSWKQNVKKGNPYATFDVNWVSQEGGAGSGFADSTIGAFSEEGAQNILAQLGVRGANWGTAVAYRYGSTNARLRDPNTPNALGFRTLAPGQSSNSVSLAGFWEPTESGWIPSLSAGFSYTDYSTGSTAAGVSREFWSWMAGLQWKDVFAKGNSAGFAIGQPLYTAQNAGLMYEWFYKFQATDNISITPAIFYISDNFNGANAGNSSFGGVIQTTFKF